MSVTGQVVDKKSGKKPSLVIHIDWFAKRVMGFDLNGHSYKIEGECLRCGECCRNMCRLLDFDENGKAVCLVHSRMKPVDCFLFPATRSPNLPLPEGCGYRIVEVI